MFDGNVTVIALDVDWVIEEELVTSAPSTKTLTSDEL
jgi:hypothetical protein